MRGWRTRTCSTPEPSKRSETRTARSGASTRPTPSSTRCRTPATCRDRSEELRRRASSVTRTWTEFGEQLSDREIAVLRLAGEGLTQREIADQLFISYNTVKSHLKTSYRKLGATSRDEALIRSGELSCRQRIVAAVDVADEAKG